LHAAASTSDRPWAGCATHPIPQHSRRQQHAAGWWPAAAVRTPGAVSDLASAARHGGLACG